MAPARSLSRRRLLASYGSAVTLAALAGCAVGVGSDGDGPAAGTDGADPGGDDGSVPDALDLREANVVGVSLAEENGTYTFDVTLHHDDDGEDGYANWWQVERLDGTRLGRRDLRHAHSRQPFTRSERIEIPDEVNCVVVRGHDRTHGYGGVAAVVALDSGEARTIDQGPERRPFDDADCPR